jgi:hypothetical protein
MDEASLDPLHIIPSGSRLLPQRRRPSSPKILPHESFAENPVLDFTFSFPARSYLPPELCSTLTLWPSLQRLLPMADPTSISEVCIRRSVLFPEYQR